MGLEIESTSLKLLIAVDAIMLIFLIIQSLESIPKKVKTACAKLNWFIKCGRVNVSIVLILWLLSLIYMFVCATDIMKLSMPVPNETLTYKLLRLKGKWGMEVRIYLLYFFVIINM